MGSGVDRKSEKKVGEEAERMRWERRGRAD